MLSMLHTLEVRMKPKQATLLFAVAALLTAYVPVFAHHGAATYDDVDHLKTVSGIVTKFVWVNPHTLIYFDVKDTEGNVVQWGCETLSPSILLRKGWTKDSVKPGDSIIVTVAPRKDGKPFGTLSGYKIVVNGKELDVKL